jgi:DNA-directed RNA polymerase specialized sigma subunit
MDSKSNSPRVATVFRVQDGFLSWTYLGQSWTGSDDVQKVIELLESVRKLDELIIAKEAERQQLWTAATRMTPEMTGMPHAGGVTDKVGNIAVKLAMLAQETDAAWDRYIDQRSAVIALLEKLPANEYGVLHREYIRYMTQEAIARDMGYSTVQIWRIKQNALESLKHVMKCN